ncbi:MAG TPA: hypothetical protein VIC55_05445, partial [Gemmatimonadaceae bacterium]
MRRSDVARLAVALVSLLCVASVPGSAQVREAVVIAHADTLLIAGRVFAAESLYYDAVRWNSHNPAARLALGKYLAARGALKVGAVLMEEARFFGGDQAEVARALAPVYQRLGAYGALASLPGSPLPYAERARAEWLRDHPPTVAGPDSAWVSYHVSDSHLLGQVTLQIGADKVEAIIDARERGLVLDPVWMGRREVRRFASRGARGPGDAAGVVLAVRLGAFTFTNVPARFERQRVRGTAVIGLDVLAALAPTFDPPADRMLLRRGGDVGSGMPGFRIPTLTTEAGVFVVKTETVFPIGHPDVQQYLRRARWTLDARR